jgi:hypothetical protein
MEDWVMCPICGTRVTVTSVSRLGRKLLGIRVKNICDTLMSTKGVSLAAK